MPDSPKHMAPEAETLPPVQKPTASVGRSALIMTGANIVSRVTGFIRTWIMAFALGNTLLSSSYQIANNLPNMIYELAMGGILVTAFLPVYVSVKSKQGSQRANQYASNLIGIVLVVLGIVAILGTLFSPALIHTQTFMNDSGDADIATYFFRFFAIQVVFYGVGTILSGLLNAERDFLMASIAPVFNNLIVIVTMLGFVFIVPQNEMLARTWLAVGTSLGVLVQMAVQIPALKKNGIIIRPHIDIHDPALKETFKIGVPALVFMLDTTVTVSVYTAVAFGISESGPSVIYYARMWWTLPYALLAVPITTALFTEFSSWYAQGDMKRFRDGYVSGMGQILFFMIPFALYLAVFAVPLTSLYHAGAFTQSDVLQVAWYLIGLAPSLPFYALFTYLNKVYSSIHDMKTFVLVDVVNAIIQCIVFLVLGNGIGSWEGLGLVGINVGIFVYNVLACVVLSKLLPKRVGSLNYKPVIGGVLRSLGLGLLGAGAGGVVVYGAYRFIPSFFSVGVSLAVVVTGGLLALLITYGIALRMNVPEAAFATRALTRLKSKLHRG